MNYIRYIAVLGLVALLLSIATTAGGQSGTAITAENADQIELLNILGRGKVTDLAVHPDGEHAAVATTAGIWFYEFSDQPPRFFGGHTGPVNSIAFSPDGRYLVSGSDDFTVRLWDVAAGTTLHVLEGHQDAVLTVAYSPDGTKILSGGGDRDKTVRLWDAATGELLRTVEYDSFIRRVAFLPDGQAALTAQGRGLELWDVSSGETTEVYENIPWDVYISPSLYFSGSTRLATLGEMTFNAQVWDFERAEYVHDLGQFNRPVGGTAFSADGTLLAAGDREQLVIWELASGRELARFEDFRGGMVTFTPDNRSILYTTVFGGLTLREIATGDIWAYFDGFTEHVRDMALLPSTGELVTIGTGRFIHLWSIQTGHYRMTMDDSDRIIISSVAAAPDGSAVVYALFCCMGDNMAIRHFPVSAPGRITLWDRIIETNESVGRLAFLPDGQTVLSVGRQVRLWDVNTGRLLRTIVRRDEEPGSFALSPDGRLLLLGYRFTPVELWDVQNATQIRIFEGAGGGVTFTPDASHFAHASAGMIRLTDIETGTTQTLFAGASDRRIYLQLTFSPDGRLLVFIPRDNQIAGMPPVEENGSALWILDTATGEVVARIPSGHTDSITGIIFAADGSFFVTGSMDGTARVWGIP